MSLIDINLQRRPRSGSHFCQPSVEVLEERQCPSVAAPTGLHLTALSSTQVKLNWNDVANETGFRVFEWNGTQSVLLKTVAKGVTTFTATNLKPDQTQMFRVEAFNISSQADSAWASIATPADPITVATNIHITAITQTSMTLQWTNATGATSYNVYGWNGTGAFLIGTATRTTPALKVNNLTAGVTYYFYVQSVNATNSANSDWLSGATSAVGLTAPANLKAQPVDTSTIGLSWNNVATATGYRVYTWNGVATSSATLLATLAKNTTGYQAIGLLPGTMYWYYVQAFNGSSTANSAWVTATTPAALPLQAPTQLAVQITGPNSVILSWVEPARAVGYQVYVWTGTAWSLVSTVPAGTHTAAVTGLRAGQTNWFFVEAFTTNFAEASYSNEVFANM